MTESGQTRFFYLRDEHGLPVVCVASKKTEAEVGFSVSTFNPKDVFSKNIARRIAEGRLQAGKVATLPLATAANLPRGVKQLILIHIATSLDYPGSARKLAHSWLEQAGKKQMETERTKQ